MIEATNNYITEQFAEEMNGTVEFINSYVYPDFIRVENNDKEIEGAFDVFISGKLKRQCITESELEMMLEGIEIGLQV